MEPTLPTIEELHDQLVQNVLKNDVLVAATIFTFYRIHAQAMLLVAQELEQINNNLEALRRGDRS